jgi:hypothetical protein
MLAEREYVGVDGYVPMARKDKKQMSECEGRVACVSWERYSGAECECIFVGDSAKFLAENAHRPLRVTVEVIRPELIDGYYWVGDMIKRGRESWHVDSVGDVRYRRPDSGTLYSTEVTCTFPAVVRDGFRKAGLIK